MPQNRILRTASLPSVKRYVQNRALFIYYFFSLQGKGFFFIEKMEEKLMLKMKRLEREERN